MATAERETPAATMQAGSSSLPTAAEEELRSLKTKKTKNKVLDDDGEFAAGAPASFPSSPFRTTTAYYEEDDDFVLPPAQCASSNLGTAEGVRQCQDACEPGLCCLAEQGQRIEFAVSTGSGKLTGCRSDANANWCDQFEGCLSILALANQHHKDAEPDALVEASHEIETQCRSPAIETIEGAEQCADACTPGLCCLADEGTSAAFSVPGKAGEVMTVAGCRSPSNEAQCIHYLPCAGAFEPAAADLKAGGTTVHSNNPRQVYAAGAVFVAFAAFAVQVTLAAVRQLRGSEGRIRRRDLGEYEQVRLLDDAASDEEDGTGSRSDDDDSESSSVESDDDDEEEEGDIENPRDEPRRKSRDNQEVVSQPVGWSTWSHRNFFGLR